MPLHLWCNALLRDNRWCSSSNNERLLDTVAGRRQQSLRVGARGAPAAAAADATPSATPASTPASTPATAATAMCRGNETTTHGCCICFALRGRDARDRWLSGTGRSSVYLLYWYKKGFIKALLRLYLLRAEKRVTAGFQGGLRQGRGAGTQFTCFTGTTVQILTQKTCSPAVAE